MSTTHSLVASPARLLRYTAPASHTARRTTQIVLHTALLLAIVLGAAPAAALSQAQPAAIPAASLLNPDGTLRLDGAASGAINLSGWNVSLDPQRGPVFAPALAPAGEWGKVGTSGMNNGSLVGPVYAIAISGTDVYVGGFFLNVGNNGTSLNAADYVAKWDGSNWSALGSNGAGNGSLNGWVYAIAISGTDVYVGGLFTNVNNGGTSLTAADCIAKWDGTNWSALGSNGAGGGSLSGQVNAIAISGTDVYVGGGFIDVNNNGTSLTAADRIAKWDGTNWSALGSGIAGNGSLNGSVLAILVSGTDVYVGGAFTNVSNETSLPAADYVAKWDGTNWSALGSNGASNGSLNYGVYALAPGSEDLYVGGDFTNANNGGIAITDADYFAAYGFTPLAAGLADFTVQVQEQGILVAWETTSELGNLGFDLWRGETPNAPTQRLNAALIPSQAPGSSQGFSYAWLDQDNLVMGATYYYWLDVVEVSGAHERHGPLSVTWQAPTALVVDSFTAGTDSVGKRLLAWLLGRRSAAE